MYRGLDITYFGFKSVLYHYQQPYMVVRQMCGIMKCVYLFVYAACVIERQIGTIHTEVDFVHVPGFYRAMT